MPKRTLRIIENIADNDGSFPLALLDDTGTIIALHHKPSALSEIGFRFGGADEVVHGYSYMNQTIREALDEQE